jgi:hypothetical protein
MAGRHFSSAQGIEAEIPQPPAGARGIGADSPVAAPQGRRCAHRLMAMPYNPFLQHSPKGLIRQPHSGVVQPIPYRTGPKDLMRPSPHGDAV